MESVIIEENEDFTELSTNLLHESAQPGERCAGCGYPFDAGELVLMCPATGDVLCCASCAE